MITGKQMATYFMTTMTARRTRRPPSATAQAPSPSATVLPTYRRNDKMTKDPRITALRMLAVALDTDNDARTDHGRAILNEIDQTGAWRDVLCELADIAASLQRCQYGFHAYVRALEMIQRLVIEPDQRTPRPLKDRPNRRKMN
jgi:hypothetical protein